MNKKDISFVALPEDSDVKAASLVCRRKDFLKSILFRVYLTILDFRQKLVIQSL